MSSDSEQDTQETPTQEANNLDPGSSPIRHTARVFGPLLAVVLACLMTLGLALFLEWPREIIISLSALLAGLLVLGPYLWFVVRSLALQDWDYLLWTADGDPDEIHLTKFSPRAYQRLQVVDSLVSKSSFVGDVYVGRNLRREQVTPPMQSEPVLRYRVNGVWRGALDWWEFEQSAAALNSYWSKVVPKAKEAARIEGEASADALDLALDETAAVLFGIEEDTFYNGDDVDQLTSIDEPLDWIDEDEPETVEDTDPQPDPVDPDAAVQEASADDD